MAMVQTPDSTEYDGMPRSAIATGLVDYQLSPREMPGQLMAYVAHALGSLPRGAVQRPHRSRLATGPLRNSQPHNDKGIKSAGVYRAMG